MEVWVLLQVRGRPTPASLSGVGFGDVSVRLREWTADKGGGRATVKVSGHEGELAARYQ